MPNWCMNRLTINGNKEKVASFFDLIKGDSPDENGNILLFDFNKILPMPKELEINSPTRSEDKEIAASNLEKFGFENWYNWKVSNWGTKWNPSNEDLDIVNEPDINNYSISFNSAWSPPCPIVIKLGELFPDLEFQLDYFEPSMGFAGCLSVVGLESHDDYSEDPKTIEQIGREIFCMDDFFEDSEDESEEKES